jgi:hypothetical protein
MLKSSDRVSHDIEILQQRPQHPESADASSSLTLHTLSDLGHPPPPRLTSGRGVLALRRWSELRPEREFRCFVRGGEIVGACQRDVSQYFPQLSSQGDRTGVTDGTRVGTTQSDQAGSSPLHAIKGAILRFHRDQVSPSASSGGFSLQDCEFEEHENLELLYSCLN